MLYHIRLYIMMRKDPTIMNILYNGTFFIKLCMYMFKVYSASQKDRIVETMSNNIILEDVNEVKNYMHHLAKKIDNSSKDELSLMSDLLKDQFCNALNKLLVQKLENLDAPDLGYSDPVVYQEKGFDHINKSTELLFLVLKKTLKDTCVLYRETFSKYKLTNKMKIETYNKLQTISICSLQEAFDYEDTVNSNKLATGTKDMDGSDDSSSRYKPNHGANPGYAMTDPTPARIVANIRSKNNIVTNSKNNPDTTSGSKGQNSNISKQKKNAEAKSKQGENSKSSNSSWVRGIISNFIKGSSESEQQAKIKPNLNRRASFVNGRRGATGNQIISDGYDCCKSIYRNVVAVSDEMAEMLSTSHTFISDALENSNSSVLCAVYIWRTFLISPKYLQDSDNKQGKNVIFDIDARFIQNLYYNEKDFQILHDYRLKIKEYIESEFVSHWKAIMDTMIAGQRDLEELDANMAVMLDEKMDVSNCLTTLKALDFEVKNSICLQSNIDQICRWITYSSNIYHVEVIKEVNKTLKGLKGKPERFDTYCSYLNQKLHSTYVQATKKCEYVYAYLQGNIRAMRTVCYSIKQHTKEIKLVLNNDNTNCVKFQRIIRIIADSYQLQKSTLGELVYNEISCYHKSKRVFHIACNLNFSNWRNPKTFLAFLEFYKNYCLQNVTSKIEETYDDEFISSCLYHFTDVVQGKFSLTTRYFYEYFADINKNVSLCLNQFCDTFAENQENICKQYDYIFPAHFEQHADYEYKDTSWLLYNSLEKITKTVRNVNQAKYEVATFKEFDEIFETYTFDFYTEFMYSKISCAKWQEDIKMKADIISQKMHNFLIFQTRNAIECISKNFDGIDPNENDRGYISATKNHVYYKYEIYIRVYLIFKLCDVDFSELKNLTGIYNCFAINC